MPNSFFRFKQFTIHQDRCAMKVCTDSCILGAWTALRIAGVKKILDIGTGTALLPLMLAQKSDAQMDTIEQDPESCIQARENIRQSPWAGRIRLIEGDARNHVFPASYDFIISNPPFFESDLRSPEQKKNMAKHEETLTLEKLIGLIKANLRKDGAFCVLLPFHRTGYFESQAGENGFVLRERLTVKQTPNHDPFRSILLFGNSKSGNIISEELIIKKERKYSAEFRALMQDYYG